MNGIDNIINKITSDAQREANELRATAEKNAAESERVWNERAERDAAKITNRAKAEADDRVERQNAMNELEKRKLILASKRRVMDKSFDEALKSLRALPDGEYYALLMKIGARAVETGREEIVLSGNDRAKYGEKLVTELNAARKSEGKTASLRLSELTRETGGGVIVKDGDVEINGKLEAVVSSLREPMSSELAAVLFPDK